MSPSPQPPAGTEAEPLLARLAAASADLIAGCDGRLRLTTFNVAYRDEHVRVHGRPPVEGMDVAGALPMSPEGWEATAGLWRRALAGESFTAEVGLTGPDGERRAYDVAFQPLRDGAGAVAGAFHVARRVRHPAGEEARRLEAERQRRRVAERRLRELEERRGLAVAASGIGEWDYDPATRRLTWPARVRELIGVASEEPASFEEALERIHPDDRRYLLDHLAGALDPHGSGTLRIEFRAVHPDGRVVWVHARGRTTFEDGPTGRRPVLLRGAALDITSHKDVERELREAKEAAERASESKSRFLATMSHELRTPLTTVIGLADLMGSGVLGPVNEKQRERLARLMTAAWHLGAIIDEILTFSRAESDKLEVSIQRVDAGRIVQSVVDVLEPQAETKGIEIAAVGLDAPVVVRTDAGKLRQIAQNLVGNAVKFTERGRVEVALRQVGHWLEMEVRDTGIGIPEEWQGRVFEPFTQVDGTATRSVGGTGLGLAVVQRLVTLLSGTIEVRSEPGTGSTFTLRLPFDPTEGVASGSGRA